MILSLILPVEGSDLLFLCRLYCFLTAVAMISGHPFWGTCAAVMGVYAVQGGNTYSTSKRIDGETLDQWMILNSYSAMASGASWLLLFMSKLSKDEDRAYQTYFISYTVQKLWSLGLVYVIFQEIRLMLPERPERPTRTSDRRSSISESIRETIEQAVSSVDRRYLMRGKGGPSKRSSLSLTLYEIRVRVLKGRDLTPMDPALLSFSRKMVISDPYVVLWHGQNLLGRTKYVRKTLNPTWPANLFVFQAVAHQLEVHPVIECHVYDYDVSSSDDAMGTAYVPIPKEEGVRVRKWYKVGKGKGQNYCPEASGEILVEIEIFCN